MADDRQRSARMDGDSLLVRCGEATLRFTKRGDRLLASLECRPPPQMPWPLAFELDVCDTLDVFLDRDWSLDIRPDGWRPSNELCPVVFAKLSIQEDVAAWFKSR